MERRTMLEKFRLDGQTLCVDGGLISSMGGVE
jgi:hypothetical protein